MVSPHTTTDTVKLMPRSLTFFSHPSTIPAATQIRALSFVSLCAAGLALERKKQDFVTSSEKSLAKSIMELPEAFTSVLDSLLVQIYALNVYVEPTLILGTSESGCYDVFVSTVHVV